jgi:hypothetical protein
LRPECKPSSGVGEAGDDFRDEVRDEVGDGDKGAWPGLVGVAGALSLMLLFPPFLGLLQSGRPCLGQPVAYQYLYAILMLTSFMAWMRQPRIRRWAGLGLLAGLGGLIRPTLVLYGMVTLALGTWIWLVLDPATPWILKRVQWHGEG